MTTTVASRPSTGSRRAGYVIAAAINGVLLWLIDVSLVATIALNLIYMVRDPRWLTAAGAVVTTAIGLAAAVRMLQVFPFDFGDSEFWPVVVRVGLWLAVVGAAIGIIVNLVPLVRARDAG
jgi:peptidoglycan biosynthesis protein MviN/MurJ (putative lipid II flippase)